MTHSNTGIPNLIAWALLLLAFLFAGASLWQLGEAQARNDRIPVHAEAASLARRLAAQAQTSIDHARTYAATANPVVQAFYKDGLLRSAREQAAALRRLEVLQSYESSRAFYQALLSAHEAYVHGRDAALRSSPGNTTTSQVLLREDFPALSRRYVDSANALARHHARVQDHLTAEARYANRLAYTGLATSFMLSLAMGACLIWQSRRRKHMALAGRDGTSAQPGAGAGRENNALFRAAATVEELAATIRETEDALRKDFREQRREFFRVQVPVRNPATWTVTDPSMDLSGTTFPVHDISAGGLRLVDADLLLGETVDQTVVGRLDMPGFQSVEVALHVLRVDQTLVSGTRYSQTVAGRYVDLSTNRQIPILQYIGELERAMMARRRAME